MHYTVHSWNELLRANTNKLKLSNSLCHRAKPKHLEADWATGSWTCDNRRPVERRYMVIRDAVPEVQFHYEEADRRIVLHARHARRNDSVTHWHWHWANVFLLPLAHSKSLTLKRCYMKKGRGAKVRCKSTAAKLTTASWGVLIGVNSTTGCDNISAFFGKGKWKTVQLWRVSRERVISIQWEL